LTTLSLLGLKGGLDFMTPAKVLTLIRELKVVELKKDHYLFKQGELGDQAFVVLDGELILFTEESDQPIDEEKSKQEQKNTIHHKVASSIGSFLRKQTSYKPH
jgi:hypothetical protein